MFKKFKFYRVSLLVAVLAVFGALVVISVPTSQMQDRMKQKNMKMMSADEVLASWSDKSKEVAMMMMKKYGQPNEATMHMLVWHNNGPWKRTVVYRDEVQHNFPMPHPDLLEQFINYRMPPEKFSEIAMYDGSVIVERTKGVMSARCDKEEANFLALNLANDIATGKRSVEDAREFYAKTIMELMNGKRSPYTQGLQFQVSASGTADPGQPAEIFRDEKMRKMMMDKDNKMMNKDNKMKKDN